MNRKTIYFFGLALVTLLCIGIDMFFADIVEPIFFGTEKGMWAAWQSIFHWVLLSVIWIVLAYQLIKFGMNKCNFGLLDPGKKMSKSQLAVAGAFVVYCAGISFIDTSGIRLVSEFQSLGFFRFFFMQIFFLVEALMIILLMTFAQKAFEELTNLVLPYTAILFAVILGCVQTVISRDIVTGLLTAMSGAIYGSAYLIVNRDIKKSVILLYLLMVV